MASQKANQARLKSAVEFGKTEMSDSSELHQSVLRAVFYAMMELAKKLATSRPNEASAARILRELVKHQRLG